MYISSEPLTCKKICFNQLQLQFPFLVLNNRITHTILLNHDEDCHHRSPHGLGCCLCSCSYWKGAIICFCFSTTEPQVCGREKQFLRTVIENMGKVKDNWYPPLLTWGGFQRNVEIWGEPYNFRVRIVNGMPYIVFLLQ